MADIKQLDSTYIANTYHRFPVTITSGKGSLVYDDEGKEYIDLGSGIAVNSFGVCDDEWIAAVTKQLSAVQHSSNYYYTAPCAILAGLLCQKSGMKKVFFGNSGTEANEGAVKAARKYAAEKKGEDYYTIITLKDSFHGRTLSMLAATGQDQFHGLYKPLTPGFAYADANDLEGLKKLAFAVKPAAIMIECVQGEGGVVALDQAFVQGLAKIAEEKELLLICDEVQTGNGRTGKFCAYMHYGITPDLVTTAKGLGGGLPIGACLFGERTEDIMSSGKHGSTFGANPVCCAGGVSVLERITDELMAEVMKKSDYIRRELETAPGVKSVTGLGLMLGIESERPASEVIQDCIADGVLVLSAKTKVRLLPPLNIDWDDLKIAIAILKGVLAK